MNNSWKVICLAISNSLLNIQRPVPENVDWDEVFREAKKQSVVSIVKHGIYDFLPLEIRNEWQMYIYQDYGYTIRLIDEQQQLVSLLEGQNIPFCILKGTSAAIYYPEPLLRSMGDIDFYIPADSFEKAEKNLHKAGYVFNSVNDDIRHIHLSKNGIPFEMHHYFSQDEGDRLIDSYISNAFPGLDKGVVTKTVFPMLPKLENGLVLLTHLRQHLLSGVGIRQVLDWMMYVNAVLDDYYWETTFKAAAKKTGLETLAIVATRLCQLYFGLSQELQWCKTADQDVCEQLMEIIIDSGNFGKEHGAGLYVEKTLVMFHKEGIFSYLQRAGEYNWDAYHKNSRLKPFAWIYQIFRYGKQVINSGRTGEALKEDMDRSYRRYKILKKLDIM